MYWYAGRNERELSDLCNERNPAEDSNRSAGRSGGPGPEARNGWEGGWRRNKMYVIVSFTWLELRAYMAAPSANHTWPKDKDYFIRRAQKHQRWFRSILSHSLSLTRYYAVLYHESRKCRDINYEVKFDFKQNQTNLSYLMFPISSLFTLKSTTGMLVVIKRSSKLRENSVQYY